VLVTGGTKGMGAAMVERFRMSGARIATTARSEPVGSKEDVLFISLAVAAAMEGSAMEGNGSAAEGDGIPMEGHGSAAEAIMMKVVTMKKVEPKRGPYRSDVGERRV
jgi:NAD(P)-dependent dehydrogenase (short-subunit alcohol dehydrogenase family)